MSLCVPQSPFQRVHFPPRMSTGDAGGESTLQAESLSSSSKDESSSSSSSPATSWRGSSPSSGTAAKSGWLKVSEVGGGRTDWQPSVAEKPGQLKLWKVCSFCIEEKKEYVFFFLFLLLNIWALVFAEWCMCRVWKRRLFHIFGFCPHLLQLLREYCNTVLCHEATEIFVDYKTSPDFPSAWGRVDNDGIHFHFGWSYPLRGMICDIANSLKAIPVEHSRTQEASSARTPRTDFTLK